MKISTFSNFQKRIVSAETIRGNTVAKAGPGYDFRSEHPPVQINSTGVYILIG
jgi:hypothetical protein